ncbi:hypothetical protein [Saccharothrix obliqua]|uniref:hypothetical protein n=1 Tax=Saccharothrix obliqua TaxID=2861747 RepID=UPI001C604FBE|nr:hypothetical protein [Saccharothrix obliqua]MBW4722377.1 hypothetical protein [Saccharothrix obliqua]
MDARGYGRDELCHLLLTGADTVGSAGVHAAVHLLTFTALPGRGDFAGHVEIRVGTHLSGRTELGAFVRDWERLARHENLDVLTGQDERLVALAAGWAAGVPVRLERDAAGLSSASLRRVLEAVLLASNGEPYFMVVRTSYQALLPGGGRSG